MLIVCSKIPHISYLRQLQLCVGHRHALWGENQHSVALCILKGWWHRRILPSPYNAEPTASSLARGGGKQYVSYLDKCMRNPASSLPPRWARFISKCTTATVSPRYDGAFTILLPPHRTVHSHNHAHLTARLPPTGLTGHQRYRKSQLPLTRPRKPLPIAFHFHYLTQVILLLRYAARRELDWPSRLSCARPRSTYTRLELGQHPRSRGLSCKLQLPTAVTLICLDTIAIITIIVIFLSQPAVKSSRDLYSTR
jgi:hypothetical protein